MLEQEADAALPQRRIFRGRQRKIRGCTSNNPLGGTNPNVLEFTPSVTFGVLANVLALPGSAP
jgi:hypothetical protein